MKLEHRKQEVATFPKFLKRLLRYWFFTSLVVFGSLALGVAGYMIWGGLSLIDSFQMASMILTGMGPVKEMTTSAGKLFSSFYALYSGIAFLSISAVLLAPVIHRLLHILHVELESRESEARD